VNKWLAFIGFLLAGAASPFGVKVIEHPIGFILLLLSGWLQGYAFRGMEK